MIINLNLLPQEIKKEVVIPESFYENTSIKKLENIFVEGIIKLNAASEVIISLHVTGKMYLEDAVTNELIKYPLDIQINDNLDEAALENPIYLEKNKNTLDILKFLLENIVMEVPICVTTHENMHMSGDGWELNSEDSDEEINQKFSELSKIFEGGE